MATIFAISTPRDMKLIIMSSEMTPIIFRGNWEKRTRGFREFFATAL